MRSVQNFEAIFNLYYVYPVRRCVFEYKSIKRFSKQTILTQLFYPTFITNLFRIFGRLIFYEQNLDVSNMLFHRSTYGSLCEGLN